MRTGSAMNLKNSRCPLRKQRTKRKEELEWRRPLPETGLARFRKSERVVSSKGDIKSWRTTPGCAVLVMILTCFPLQGHLVK